MTVLRLVAAALIAGIVVVATAAPSDTHAELESSEPANGERLDQSPDVIVLRFTESVGSPANGLLLLDETGARIDIGEVDVDGSTITAPVETELPDGTYVVSWRAISADSHPIRGAFAFVVGDGPAADLSDLLGGGSDDRPWHVAAAIARGLAYLGALLAAGGALYLAVVDEHVVRPGRRLLVAATIVGAVGLLATLPIQARLATGLGLGALLRDGVARDVLADGVGLAIGVSLAGLACVAVGSRTPGAVRRPLLALGAAAAVGGFGAAGHTTETDHEWLATTSNIVHAGAGAAWFGGLAMLALSLRLDEDGGGASAGAVARFSRVATVAILTIGVAGSVVAWGEVRSIDALTSTTYGRLLIAKVAVVAGVALVGLYNRTRLVPAVVDATSTPRARRLLGRTVAVEAGALVVAIALTAVLVNVTPARAANAPDEFSATQPFGDGQVELVVDPARAGETSIHAFVLDGSGDAAELPDGSDVSFELRLPSADIGPIDAVPFLAGPGHYQVDGASLSVPGRWQITVAARVDRFEVQTATFEVPISP